MQNTLHHGFIDKHSAEYKRARSDTYTDLACGLITFTFFIIVVAAFMNDRGPGWLAIVLGVAYAVISGFLAHRFYTNINSCYGLQRRV